jgi:hypothetical protein
MRVTTTRALTVCGIAAAVATLTVLAPVATMAQAPAPYYRSQPNLGFAPRPDFPGAKQQTLSQKCVTYAQKNAGEAEPGSRQAFYDSCMHGMNTTAK